MLFGCHKFLHRTGAGFLFSIKRNPFILFSLIYITNKQTLCTK